MNDAAVMGAWAKDQKIAGSMVTFLADPTSALTKALGLELTHPGPVSVLGKGRCKRFAIYFDNGVCKSIQVSETPDDPTDGNLELSQAEHMLTVV